MADDLRQAFGPGLLSALWRCERDLREQFNDGPRLRHAFMVRAALSADNNVQVSIEKGFKWGMGADRFESLWGLLRLRGELWEFFMLDRGVSENEKSAWYETWESLDRIVVSPEFRSAFPNFQDTESWLSLVYRFAWMTIEFKPATIFYNFESGNPGNLELTDLDRWDRWLSGNLQLSRGEHFVHLRRDIRKCSLDALRSIIGCVEAVKSPDAPMTPACTTEPPDESTPTTPQKTKRSKGTGDDPAATRLLKVFANGVADEKFRRAASLLQNEELTTNDKLAKIDCAIPFPPTASAEQLGQLLGVTKQAVMKTDWWIQHRKGKKAEQLDRRRAVHDERAKQQGHRQPMRRALQRPTDEDE